jgi:hypothetical protein
MERTIIEKPLARLAHGGDWLPAMPWVPAEAWRQSEAHRSSYAEKKGQVKTDHPS